MYYGTHAEMPNQRFLGNKFEITFDLDKSVDSEFYLMDCRNIEPWYINNKVGYTGITTYVKTLTINGANVLNIINDYNTDTSNYYVDGTNKVVVELVGLSSPFLFRHFGSFTENTRINNITITYGEV